jgi:flagellar hook-basal body complex protein FliE
MSAIEAISVAGANNIATTSIPPAGVATPKAEPPRVGFGDLLSEGIANVEKKIETADTLVRAFALDDTIPIHQVTIAIEEARLAVDLALQVRTRVVEAYREIMNTQL